MSKQNDYNRRKEGFQKLENDMIKRGISKDEARSKAREIDNRASKAIENSQK